jgi:hypothetical protein
MNKYIVTVRRAVIRHGEFSHNTDRDVMIYASSITEAEIKAESGLRDKEEDGFLGEASKEWISKIYDQGQVQHNIEVGFSMESNGVHGVLTLVNTVEDPVMALADALGKIARENKPVLFVKITPIEIKEV